MGRLLGFLEGPAPPPGSTDYPAANGPQLQQVLQGSYRLIMSVQRLVVGSSTTTIYGNQVLIGPQANDVPMAYRIFLGGPNVLNRSLLWAELGEADDIEVADSLRINAQSPLDPYTRPTPFVPIVTATLTLNGCSYSGLMGYSVTFLNPSSNSFPLFQDPLWATSTGGNPSYL